jgi:hypothetical protein
MDAVQYYRVKFVPCSYQYVSFGHWHAVVAIRGQPNTFRLRQELQRNVQTKLRVRLTIHIYILELSIMKWNPFQRATLTAYHPPGDPLAVSVQHRHQ